MANPGLVDRKRRFSRKPRREPDEDRSAAPRSAAFRPNPTTVPFGNVSAYKQPNSQTGEVSLNCGGRAAKGLEDGLQVHLGQPDTVISNLKYHAVSIAAQGNDDISSTWAVLYGVVDHVGNDLFETILVSLNEKWSIEQLQYDALVMRFILFLVALVDPLHERFEIDLVDP